MEHRHRNGAHVFNPGHGSRFLRGYLFSERQRHGLRLLPTGPEVHKSQLHKPAESRRGRRRGVEFRAEKMSACGITDTSTVGQAARGNPKPFHLYISAAPMSKTLDGTCSIDAFYSTANANADETVSVHQNLNGRT